MNQVTDEKKDRTLKIMAIVGFVAIVVFGVWLAVQVVGFMPQAINSLASIADNVYQDSNEVKLVVTKQNSVVNSEDPFSISWNKLEKEGVYTFLYTCTNGVSMIVTDPDGNQTNASCDEKLSLGGDVTQLQMNVSSEKQRFTDVEYEIGFIERGSTEQLAVSSNAITVVNPEIPFANNVAEEDSESETPVETETEVVETEQEVTTPEVVTPETTTPETPTTIETVIFTDPVSDPNGFVDLAIEIVAVGHLDSNGNFVQRANIDDDARGAFQFQVTNIGTKTSGDWELEAKLTSGVNYQAPTQSALKPKEKIVFTLGYDNIGENGVQTIGATVDSDEDSNNSNDSFTWAVNVVE